ncbi:hypothetical protein CCHL11_09590 [Colletotrichum chlorophyti]|uniref:Uncharacterized protein n=1 Tax=Colletotrichum chlorophyti TaxID=708187 RepID=A0A1Q8RSR9_9PEZI|nr:hypothetical protein CCHL11_09590 [Colletotrichum chlorophyti]
MKTLSLTSILLAIAAVTASPLPESGAGKTLQEGEFLLMNQGQLEIANETRVHEFLKSEGISLEAPEIDHDWLNFTAPDKIDANIEARDSCSNTVATVTDKTERFLDWDVQMSPVVIGAGNTGIDMYISSGWSVSNAVTVSPGLSNGALKTYLGVSFGVDYTKTWTTTTTLQYKVTVLSGQAGVWVTQPWTTRRYGRQLRGCPGSFTTIGTWMADSHDDGSYGNAKWVSGIITSCIKGVPQNGGLTRCHGSGEFR